MITRDTDYAVRALCYISKRKDKVVCVKDLANCLNVPMPFLRKILQILSKEEILKSHKGKGGGFILSRHPKNISLIELINIFQGQLQLTEHTFRKVSCPEIRRCSLKKRLDVIERYVEQELGAINIARLLKEEE